MARLNTFFLPPEEWPAAQGDLVTIKGAEAKHMGTVLRTEKGSEVRLFDGLGRTGMFAVREINKNNALLESLSLESHPAPDAGLTLAIGWGKSKRRNYLFEKAVELHASGLIFWQAKRSQGHVPKAPKETWADKCIQAAKQCGNSYLPDISTANSVGELMRASGEFDKCYIAWESPSISVALSPSMLSKGRTLVVIGPEGGFDASEAESLIEGGFAPVTLGQSILRWETAATYCLSLAFFGGQDTK